MWKQIVDLARQLLALRGETRQNTADIRAIEESLRDLRQELRTAQADIKDSRQEANQLRVDFVNLIRVVERLSMDIQRERQAAQDAQEIVLLRLEKSLHAHGLALAEDKDKPA
jgi:chromosome segregation ATPase